MNRETELRAIAEIADFIARGTTAMEPDVAHVKAVDLVGAARTAQEREILFRAYPQVVVPSAALREPGDFVTETVAGLPLLVVRDTDGTVRVMLNACRHRGNKVVTAASGNQKVFTCQYHAWSYGPRGNCISLVDRAGFAGVKREDVGLITYPSEERHGLIWMHPDRTATLNVRDYLRAELDDELTTYARHMKTLFATDHRHERFNWKFGVNTFQELFHLGHLHTASLGRAFIGNVSSFKSYAPHQRLSVVRGTFPEMLAKPEAERDLFTNCTLVYVLFPNICFIWQLDHVEIWRFSPADGDDNQADITLWMLIDGEPDTERLKRHWDRNWEITKNVVYGEDFVTMTAIQKNLSTGELDGVVYGRNEVGLQDYHRNISAALERK